jgi:8-oxo-dGTP pyrophosphatase MutT (NUDIX family)
MNAKPRRTFPTVRETSAGGLVLNARLAVPIIARQGRRGDLRWSLPKGHVEHGESAAQAAVREIAEETGITGRVLTRIGSIDFYFIENGRRIHKTVHHFLLEYLTGQLCADDHEVAAVEWVPLGDLAGRLAYPDERRLAKRAHSLAKGLVPAETSAAAPRRQVSAS